VRALKITVIILGMLILLGFGVVGYEVFRRATDPTHPRAFNPPKPAAIQADLPPGSRIGQMLVLGTRVVYHVTLPDGTEQIHVLDPRDGTVQIPVKVSGS